MKHGMMTSSEEEEEEYRAIQKDIEDIQNWWNGSSRWEHTTRLYSGKKLKVTSN
jgi:hypothetical protein